MDILLRPTKLKGTLRGIQSKSITHRMIIAASLSAGVSYINDPLSSVDIDKTIEGCLAFGARIEKIATGLVIQGVSQVRRVNDTINCGESGSTLRFLIPILMTNPGRMIFTGQNKLIYRPLDDFLKIFDKQGIRYEKPVGASLPLEVIGELRAGDYHVKGNVSSQFITGLLMALPLLDGDSIIHVVTPLESKGYVDLTISVLKLAGIHIKYNKDYSIFKIAGNQLYQPFSATVEADYSQAAAFLVANALGSKVSIKGLNSRSLQGDRAILSFLTEFGATVNCNRRNTKVEGPRLTGTTIDLAQTPDLGPCLAVFAGCVNGVTRFINVNRLRIKESDRVKAICMELHNLGINAVDMEKENTLVVYGKGFFTSSNVSFSHNDHRIAMAIAIASTRANGPILLKNAECVNKSYPTFWEDFKALGGDFDEID